ncbi:MAG: dihydrodipicolinate synthase family protein [Hyphomicrobiales bacterium]
MQIAQTELPRTVSPRGHLFGQSAALVTPFTANGSIDLERLQSHVDSISGAVDGVTLFGTTGEGASLGQKERETAIDAVLDTGMSPSRMTVSVISCDIETCEAMVRTAARRGVSRFLLAPPFYFKGIDDAALERWVASLVEKVSDLDVQFILYHIPQVTGVRFDVAAIRSIVASCGTAIFGIKDSSGDWNHACQILPMDDLAIMIGDERLLAKAAPLGCAGSICGMANLVPDVIAEMIHNGTPSQELVSIIDALVSVPVTPLVKALVGSCSNDPEWARTRPPLSPANSVIVSELTPLVMSLQN